jgi:hypothetical protein
VAHAGGVPGLVFTKLFKKKLTKILIIGCLNLEMLTNNFCRKKRNLLEKQLKLRERYF